MSGSAKKLLHAAAGSSAGVTEGFVEDFFQIQTYVGNNTTNQIVNGLDLSGTGGLVWNKSIYDTSGSNNYGGHTLSDTERGIGKPLATNHSNGANTDNSGTGTTAFNNNGFTMGGDWSGAQNLNDTNFCSWAFLKQKGFFDVVTYTGDTSSSKAVAHSLGCKPGMILIKRLTTSSNWVVYHKSLPGTSGTGVGYMQINTTDNNGVNANAFGTQPTKTHFYVNANYGNMNANGVNYVAYLFADGDDSDAQIFGADGDEQIIKTGSYVGNGGFMDIDLGFEPQWLLSKRVADGGDWLMLDVVRGWEYHSDDSEATDKQLYANTSNSQDYPNNQAYFVGHPQHNGYRELTYTSTGETYIYMAIRKPHKAEAGTDVYNAALWTGNQSARNINIGTAGTTAGYYDSVLIDWRNTGSSTGYSTLLSRLAGRRYLLQGGTNNATNLDAYGFLDWRDGIRLTGASNNTNTSKFVAWGFRRRPEVYDVVCNEGTSTNAETINHALGVTPEMVWVISLDGNYGAVSAFHKDVSSFGNAISLTGHYASGSNPRITSINATTVTFDSWATANGIQYMYHLFASKDGVSKVGSYSGNNSSQNIDCGFQARWVMIRCHNVGSNEGVETSRWWVFDTTRGISSGNDKALPWDYSSAEETDDEDAIDTHSSGFTINNTTDIAANTSGRSYIFLAFA